MSLPNTPGSCTSSGTPPSSALSTNALTLASDVRSVRRWRLFIESLRTDGGIRSAPRAPRLVRSSGTRPERFGTFSTRPRPSAPGSPGLSVEGGFMAPIGGVVWAGSGGSRPMPRAVSSLTRTNTPPGSVTTEAALRGVPP